MIGGIKNIKVKAGHDREFIMLFNELKAKVRADEKGNVYYDLYRDKKEGCYIGMERYIDEAALKAHQNATHSAYYFPKIRAILEKLDVEYFESID